jgi:hypothetical protein
MTIWRMRIACWILKATNTHSEYVILTAFPLSESALALSYMFRARLIIFYRCFSADFGHFSFFYLNSGDGRRVNRPYPADGSSSSEAEAENSRISSVRHQAV